MLVFKKKRERESKGTAVNKENTQQDSTMFSYLTAFTHYHWPRYVKIKAEHILKMLGLDEQAFYKSHVHVMSLLSKCKVDETK